MKTTLKLFFFILILCSLMSCRNNDLIPIDYSDRTVIVYMAADNSLSSFATSNLESMMEGVSTNPSMGNLLVYIDQGQQPQLLKITKGANGKAVKEIVMTYPQQNSVSPIVMGSILSDIKTRFISKSYGLVLWSHGMGWFPGKKNTKAPNTKWFGQDADNYMDLPDLTAALKEGPHFNYIMFDACFMGGVETAYALNGCTDYLIASPAEVMGDGFPYEEIMQYMFGSTEKDYINLATTYYNHYNSKTDPNRSATIGCIKISEIAKLASETSKLMKAHIADLNKFSAAPMQYLEGYSPHQFYDFGYFIEYLTTAQERVAFNEQLSKTVVYKACTPTITSVTGSGYQLVPANHFSGLNCFIPQASTGSYNTSYKATQWYNVVGWNLTNW